MLLRMANKMGGVPEQTKTFKTYLMGKQAI